MTEQLHTGGNKIPISGKYSDVYPTEETLPRISSMDFMDHHTGSDGRAVRTLSLYSGYSEVAGFPIDAYYAPTKDDTLLEFKVHGYTYDDLKDIECEDDEGHRKGYYGAKIILLVLKGGVLPNIDDVSGEGAEYQKDEDIVLTPFQLMALIDTHYSHLPISDSAYGMRLFR